MSASWSGYHTATEAAGKATDAAAEADAAAKRANDAAAIVEGGLDTLLVDDQDDAKTWAVSFIIKAGHLVMVDDEKTA